MGYWEDNTVEITYNGKTTRVAKEDAHLYEKQEKAKKTKKEDK